MKKKESDHIITCPECRQDIKVSGKATVLVTVSRDNKWN